VIKNASDAADDAVVAEAVGLLVKQIFADEKALAAEYREYVCEVYRKRIAKSKSDLAYLAPDHPLIKSAPDPAAKSVDPVDRLRRHLESSVARWKNAELPTHIRALAYIAAAEAQAALQELTGETPDVTVEEAHAYSTR
jgi:hypothetical protein